MARRIDIELTSARPDGTWTWRAAGALQPRGTLEGSLVYEGAKAGDVVRADAEFEIDGITIIGVTAPKERKRAEPERLEIIGTTDHTPGVTANLTPHSGRRGDRVDGDPRPDRGPRPDGAGRTPRRGGEAGPRRGTDGAGRAGPERGPRGAGPAADRQGRERPPRAPGEPATRGPGQGPEDRPPRDRAARDRTPRDRTPRDQGAGARPGSQGPRVGPRERSNQEHAGENRAKPGEGDAASAQPRARRLSPASIHRTAVLDSLTPEHRPIAEQVLRGGIPAVRTAIHLERDKATAEGRPAPNAEALLSIAEELLPRLKAAEWRDRAEAAAKVSDDVSLRDLRSVVAGADVARDDQSRQLAADLREALERRVEAQHQEWLDDVRKNLDEGRVVRALRVSARPPDSGGRFPADLATRLAEVASEAMAPDTPPERWAALLEAVVASPVRRSVKPAGLPPEPGEALLHAARQSSGRIPALAPMLGISMPPPPGPLRPSQRPPGAGNRPPGPNRQGSRPVPPPRLTPTGPPAPRPAQTREPPSQPEAAPPPAADEAPAASPEAPPAASEGQPAAPEAQPGEAPPLAAAAEAAAVTPEDQPAAPPPPVAAAEATAVTPEDQP